MENNPQQIPQQVPVQSAPVTSPQMSSKKFLWIILGIIFVIGITCAAFYLGVNYHLALQNRNFQTVQTHVSPTIAANPTINQSATANWKAYVNTKVGFQIAYPQRYSKPSLPSGMGNSPTIYAQGNEDDQDIIFGTTSTDSFSIYPFPFSGSVNSLLTTSQATAFPPNDWISSQSVSVQSKQITIAGTIALWEKAAYKTDANQSFIGVFFVNNNHGFMIHFSPGYKEDEINTILSTFKFTDQVQNTTSADTGTVTGRLCYPSEGIPAGKIVAKSLTSGKLYSQDYAGTSAGGGTTYSFALPPDTYHMKLDVSRDPSNPYGGYYDDYSLCIAKGDYTSNSVCSGKQAVDSLPVTVIKGSTTSDIDLCDFYTVGNHTPEF